MADDNEPVTLEWLKQQGISAVKYPLRIRIMFTWLPLPDKITRGEVLTVIKIFQGGDE